MRKFERIAGSVALFSLFAAAMYTANISANTTADVVAIFIALGEALHWAYAIKNRLGAYFWGGLTLVATVALLAKLAGIRF